jgi:hypothetical protein
MYHVLLPSTCTGAVAGTSLAKMRVQCFNGNVETQSSSWHEAKCVYHTQSMCQVLIPPQILPNHTAVNTVITFFPSSGQETYSSAFPYGQDKWLGKHGIIDYIINHPCVGEQQTGRTSIILHHSSQLLSGVVNFIHDITLCDVVNSGLVVVYLPHTSQVYLLYDYTPDHIYIIMALVVVYLSFANSNGLSEIINISNTATLQKSTLQVTVFNKLVYLPVIAVVYWPWSSVDVVLIHYITMEERLVMVALLIYLLYQVFTDFTRLCQYALQMAGVHCGYLAHNNLFDVTLAVICVCVCKVYNTVDNPYISGLTAAWIIKIFYKLHVISNSGSAFLGLDVLVDVLVTVNLIYCGVLVSIGNNIHVLYMYMLQVICLAFMLTGTFLKF